MRLNRTLILAVIALVIVGLLMWQAGGPGDFLSYECKRAAEAMRVNWMWDPAKGCFIQQPNGAWVPIDTNRVYQP